MQVWAYCFGTEVLDPIFIQQLCKERCESYDVYTDLDRDNPAYRALKDEIGQNEGVVVIASLKALGRDKYEILRELHWFQQHPVILVIQRYPTTHILNSERNQVAVGLLTDIFEDIKENSQIDFRSGYNPKGGRRKIQFPAEWDSLYMKWEKNELSTKEFMSLIHVKKGTFYHLVTEYKELVQTYRQTVKVV